MIQLSPYAVLQAVVNDEASPLESPDGHVFTYRTIEAASVLAAYGDGNQANNATVCAYGLLSWSEADRNAFLDKYEVPGAVYQQLRSPAEWPFKPAEPVVMPPMPNNPAIGQE